MAFGVRLTCLPSSPKREGSRWQCSRPGCTRPRVVFRRLEGRHLLFQRGQGGAGWPSLRQGVQVSKRARVVILLRARGQLRKAKCEEHHARPGPGRQLSVAQLLPRPPKQVKYWHSRSFRAPPLPPVILRGTEELLCCLQAQATRAAGAGLRRGGRAVPSS
jgi:hypothetical protein